MYTKCEQGGERMVSAKIIGGRLVALRGEKTQKTVADAVGVSCSAIAMYESGERIPRDEVKEKIAHYYGKTIESIFFAN